MAQFYACRNYATSIECHVEADEGGKDNSGWKM